MAHPARRRSCARSRAVVGGLVALNCPAFSTIDLRVLAAVAIRFPTVQLSLFAFRRMDRSLWDANEDTWRGWISYVQAITTNTPK